MECQIWITLWIIFFIRYSRLFWIYILKNLTHAEKVGHTSEFLFGTYWWTWKTTIKKLLKWANKNQNNFNTYNLHFLKKIKKNTWRYILRMCTKPENDMIYSFWDIEHARLELVILGHVLPFYPTNNPQNQNFEKMKKNAWRYYHLHKWTKNHDHMLHCSWDTACGR